MREGSANAETMERWIVTVRACSYVVLLAACVAIGVAHGGPAGLFLILGALLLFTTGNLLIARLFGDREVRAYYATHRRGERLRVAFRSGSKTVRADALLRVLIPVAVGCLVVLWLSRRL